jgi:HSP20 family protein
MVNAMSSDDERRRKRPPWWDDDLFASQFDAIKRIVDELFERIGEEAPEDLLGPDAEEHLEEIMRELQKTPMIWGFSATIGSDGRIQMNPFGNVQADGDSTTVREERQPLIEVMNQENAIILIAELPGVKEDDILLTITETRITLRVDTTERKYAKTIDLPEPVDKDTAQVTYNNGILEINLTKRK